MGLVERGLSLVEVLAAMLLVGIALLPLFQLYPVLLGASGQRDDLTLVGTAATRQMEALVADLVRGATPPDPPAGGGACDPPPNCRLTWQVTRENLYGAQLWRVWVEAWVDTNGDGLPSSSELYAYHTTRVWRR